MMEIKKITKSYDLSDFSILTDTGWEDIVSLHETIPYEVYHLKLSDGKELKCADNHIVFYMDDMEEVFVKNLKIGNKICVTDDDGVLTESEVTEITNLGYEEIMYDFELPENSNHRYYTNGILSHNTALIEKLALIISKGNCPTVLINKRIMALDLTALVAGTKYRGQFEERIKAIIDECRDEPNVVIFIDEIHTMIGAGNGSGALDAANVLKPALARGEIQVIGATTNDEYKKHLEKDGALIRRFQKINLPETTMKETVFILENLRNSYEKFHRVRYEDGVFEIIVKLSKRYLTNRSFPDKAIDVLDELGSEKRVNTVQPVSIDELKVEIEKIRLKTTEVVKKQDYESAAKFRDEKERLNKELDNEVQKWIESEKLDKISITIDDVYDVVASMTGIPITKLDEQETINLIELEETLNKEIVGQPEAVSKIAKAIRRTRVGIKEGNKPISFICQGKSGQGKTFLAKLLAKLLFGDSKKMIKFDMSEYMEKHTVSRLIGAPPGYIGYEEGGELTEKVKNNPFCIILFDEIEKAHKDVQNIFLQILDDGVLTDGLGNMVDFTNTIIIMTSNIGAEMVMNFGTPIGFSSTKNTSDREKEIIMKEMKKHFKPEFLNRIDDIVFFNNLTSDDLKKIVKLEITNLEKRLVDNYQIIFDDTVIERIFELNTEENYGARPIKRLIEKEIENYLTDEILKGNIKKNKPIKVIYEGEFKTVDN